MAAPVISNATLVAILEEIDEAGGPLDTLVVHLFQNDYTPSAESVVADFTEATYGGYAASTAVAWTAAYIAPDGSGVLKGDQKQFIPTDSTTPNTIYGYWLELAASSANFVFAVRFDEPVDLTSPFDSLFVIPEMVFRQP